MKQVKLGILDEIKKMMGDRMANKIGKPKAMSVEVSAMVPKKDGMPMDPEMEESAEHEKSELPEMEKSEQNEMPDQSKLTPEELMQLKSLYEKMC